MKTNQLFRRCVLFQEKRVLTLLNGHTGRVNAVKWIHKPDCGEAGETVCYGFPRARGQPQSNSFMNFVCSLE